MDRSNMSADSLPVTVADLIAGYPHHLESVPIPVHVSRIGPNVTVACHDDMIARAVENFLLQGMEGVELAMPIEVVSGMKACFGSVGMPEGEADPCVTVHAYASPLADPI
jgi:hypothetical protein